MNRIKILVVCLLTLAVLPLGPALAQQEQESTVVDDVILYDETTTDLEEYPEYETTTTDEYDWGWDDLPQYAEDTLYTTQSSDPAEQATQLLGAWIVALFTGVYLFVVLILGLGGYIFSSLALMKIGKEMGYENSWFAWVPILSTIMIFHLGDQNPWLLLLLLIPGIGAFIVTIITIVALANIIEKRGYEKLLVLLALVPLGMFVLLYLLAWNPKVSVVETV